MSDESTGTTLGNRFCLKCGGMRVDGVYQHKDTCSLYVKQPPIIKDPPKPKEDDDDATGE